MAKSTLNSKTINELIELVDENKQPIAQALSKEILFLQKTLNRLKKEIDSGEVIELFEQGKQSFLRENPAIKAYNATTSKYNQTIKQFMDMIPEGKQEESDDFDRFAKSK